MNVKNLYVYIILSIIAFVFLSITGCQDRVLNIEERNAYEWQKYMNENEFNQLKAGMTYMEVVAIAGGAGIETETSVYEWRDEILLTQAYVIHFENGELTHTEIIEKRGNSMR